MLSIQDLGNLINANLAKISFSQEGEDLVVSDMLIEKKEPGFYVDVGAHHPLRFSNTLIFYMKGWNGINVDAAPGSMDAFNKMRPRDVNLECAVDENPGQITFFQFNEPALNTCSAERAEFLLKETPYQLVGRQVVEVRRLDRILSEHLPKGRNIDFLSVDVEGLDMRVVRSNDWTLYRPGLVLLEDSKSDILNIENNEIYKFMESVGYRPVVKLPRSVVYQPTR